MLHYFLRYEIGFTGLIGYYCKDIPLAASLGLILLYVLIPYLLGSINTAIIVSKYMYHDDIRRYGSGNAGFTNVMRTYGKRRHLSLSREIFSKRSQRFSSDGVRSVI